MALSSPRRDRRGTRSSDTAAAPRPLRVQRAALVRTGVWAALATGPVALLTGWSKPAPARPAHPALTGESLLEEQEERVRLQAQSKTRKTAKKTSEAEPSAPELETAPQSHPNLGDEAHETNVGAGNSEAHQDHEIRNDGTGAGEDEQPEQKADPLAERVLISARTLEGMSEAFVTSGLLRHASTDTLKTIVEAARALAEAAEGELATR